MNFHLFAAIISAFIFQRYHLLGELTALDNVEIPAIYAGRSPHEREKRAAALLQRLGMGERIPTVRDNFPVVNSNVFRLRVH